MNEDGLGRELNGRGKEGGGALWEVFLLRLISIEWTIRVATNT